MKLGQGLEEGTSPPPALQGKGAGPAVWPQAPGGNSDWPVLSQGDGHFHTGRASSSLAHARVPPPWLALKLTPPSGCLRVTATGSFTRLALP